MDSPKVNSWSELLTTADGKKGREEWWRRVRELRDTGQANFQTPPPNRPSPKEMARAPKQTRQATAADAARYRRQDAHEGFFRPRTRAARAELHTKRRRGKKKQKKKPRVLTDKERRAFAKEHYEAHHTDKYKPWETPPPISGHHQPDQVHTHTHNSTAQSQ